MVPITVSLKISRCVPMLSVVSRKFPLFNETTKHPLVCNGEWNSDPTSKHMPVSTQHRTYLVSCQGESVDFNNLPSGKELQFTKDEIFCIFSSRKFINNHVPENFINLFLMKRTPANFVQSLKSLPSMSTIYTVCLEIESVAKSLKPFYWTKFSNFESMLVSIPSLQVVALRTNSNVIEIGGDFRGKKFNKVTESIAQFLKQIMTAHKIFTDPMVFMNDSSSKKGSDSTGVKDGGEPCPGQNLEKSSQSDSNKDQDKTRKSDSGNESASQPSDKSDTSEKLQESLEVLLSDKSTSFERVQSDTSSEEKSFTEEVPHFPEEVLWDPLPEDVEMGFEEEMSESRRIKDARWFPKQQESPPSEMKYYPKLYYEEVTTYEPSAATTPEQAQAGPSTNFPVFEDPEVSGTGSPRHWSQISFDMPPSPIPGSGPARFNPMYQYDTPPGFANQSTDSGRWTTRVRRRIEFDSPSEFGDGSGPHASTPIHHEPLTSTPAQQRSSTLSPIQVGPHASTSIRQGPTTTTPIQQGRYTFSPSPRSSVATSRVRRRIFSETSEIDESPVVNKSSYAVRNSCDPCSNSSRGSTPGTISRSPVQSRSNRFVFSPEPVKQTRRPGETFVFSDDEEGGSPSASSTRGRLKHFSFSPMPIIPTDRQPGDPFVFSDDEDTNDDPPPTITQVRQTVTTCHNCDTCTEEIRETSIRKRVFPNDGSIPLGTPIVKLQTMKSVAVADDSDTESPENCPRKSTLSASRSNKVHNGSGPSSSEGKKKTPITEGDLQLKHTDYRENRIIFSGDENEDSDNPAGGIKNSVSEQGTSGKLNRKDDGTLLMQTMDSNHNKNMTRTINNPRVLPPLPKTALSNKGTDSFQTAEEEKRTNFTVAPGINKRDTFAEHRSKRYRETQTISNSDSGNSNTETASIMKAEENLLESVAVASFGKVETFRESNEKKKQTVGNPSFSLKSEEQKKGKLTQMRRDSGVGQIKTTPTNIKEESKGIDDAGDLKTGKIYSFTSNNRSKSKGTSGSNGKALTQAIKASRFNVHSMLPIQSIEQEKLLQPVIISNSQATNLLKSIEEGDSKRPSNNTINSLDSDKISDTQVADLTHQQSNPIDLFPLKDKGYATSLHPSLVSGNFILYHFNVAPYNCETVLNQLNKSKTTIILTNFFPNCHVKLKEKLLLCRFHNYTANYPLTICLLDLQPQYAH